MAFKITQPHGRAGGEREKAAEVCKTSELEGRRVSGRPRRHQITCHVWLK